MDSFESQIEEVMNQLLDEDVPGFYDKVTEAIPLDLVYACKYWAIHLESGGKSKERAEALSILLSEGLLLCIEVLNLTKQVERCVGITEKAISWIQVRRSIALSRGTITNPI